MKSAEYCRNLILGLLIREPFDGESIRFTVNLQVPRRPHQFPEKTLQGGTAGVVDDRSFATAQAPDLPDDRRDIIDLDLLDDTLGLDLQFKRRAQEGEFLGGFAHQQRRCGEPHNLLAFRSSRHFESPLIDQRRPKNDTPRFGTQYQPIGQPRRSQKRQALDDAREFEPVIKAGQSRAPTWAGNSAMRPVPCAPTITKEGQ